MYWPVLHFLTGKYLSVTEYYFAAHFSSVWFSQASFRALRKRPERALRCELWTSDQRTKQDIGGGRGGGGQEENGGRNRGGANLGEEGSANRRHSSRLRIRQQQGTLPSPSAAKVNVLQSCFTPRSSSPRRGPWGRYGSPRIGTRSSTRLRSSRPTSTPL